MRKTDPGGVLERLQGMGVDAEVITKQFHCANCDKAWVAGEMAYRMWLRVDEVKFTQADPSIALEMLVDQGRLVWPEIGGNKSRPGWLADSNTRSGGTE